MIFCRVFVFTICLAFSDALFDPFSLAAIGGAVGAGWFKYDYLKENTYCRFRECCIAPYLKHDVSELQRLLSANLYGQHIVQTVLFNAIGAHLKNIQSSRKPLVMSFHGTSGTGKNFVSDFVAQALYQKGIESNYVHKYTADIIIFDELVMNQFSLAAGIKKAIKDCPYSLFIFDEIEKLKPGVFDAIVNLLDHHSSLKGYDFSKAIFIFLSNSAGTEIAVKLKSITDSGRFRDETTLVDFERIAELGAYNVVGGLQDSKLIESHVIDHFVPFLPLEQRHVEQCIKKEFNKICHRSTSDKIISDIMKAAVTFDETHVYSNNGCKRLSKKVEAYCYMNT